MMARQMKVVVFLVFIAVVACDACRYLKFSPIHSYCLPPNPTCNVLDTTVTDADKEEVVRLHNEYRQKVALGRESAAGGLPSAANMMEMVWDDELAAVARKHAEQCIFRHDCNECRQVERFYVGQNIFMGFTAKMPSDSISWKLMVKAFYDEVSMFDRDYISPLVYDRSYGHFTQVIWATSWRLGCGRAVFKDGDKYDEFIVCNYGPTGNIYEGELYKEGPPCSACPSGTCCGSSCERYGIHSNYKGLCKAIDEDSFSI